MAKVKKSPKELEALWRERANAAREHARRAMNRRVRSISHKIARLESDEVFSFWEELSEKHLNALMWAIATLPQDRIQTCLEKYEEHQAKILAERRAAAQAARIRRPAQDSGDATPVMGAAA